MVALVFLKKGRSNHNLRSAVLFLFCALLVLGSCKLAISDDVAKITDVSVTPDARAVHIKYQGEIGKRSAFVIEKPYRLVLDIESAGLARVPGRIPVSVGGINEIRVGSTNGKARVVLDYGVNPVPPFSVEEAQEGLMIALGGGLPPNQVNSAPPRAIERPAPPVRRAIPIPEKKAKAQPMIATPQPKLLVKSATVDKEGLNIEIAEPGNRSGNCKLAIAYDHDTKVVNGATITDESGNVTKFSFAENAANEEESQTPQQLVKNGPRKETTDNTPTSPKKFQWGLRSDVKEISAPAPKITSRAPLRMESYELKLKNAMN